MIIGSAEIFEFTGVEFDTDTLTAKMHYACGEHSFCEQIRFDVGDPQNLETEELQNALRLMHLIAGISYYKAFACEVKEFEIGYEISPEVAEFLNHMYEEGLGEFYYMNKLPPALVSRFTGNDTKTTRASSISVSGYAVGLGGGKDSLVAVSLLQELGETVQTFGVNAGWLLSSQAKIIGTKHREISRTVDVEALKNIQTEDGSNVPNGHIPISAILGSIGLVNGILSGIAEVVVAVERSADEPTREYLGKMINHQYSKTSDFEKSFDTIIKHWVSEACGYFSVLRPLRELDIMKLFFAMDLDSKFAENFSSCNKAMNFTQGHKPGDPLWCGKCEKCAFIFLLMVGADRYEYAVKLFGSDLFENEGLYSTFEAVLGNTDTKPFDCVGELSESRESMDIAKRYSSSAQHFHYAPADLSPVIWSNNHNIAPELSLKLEALVLSKLGASKQ